jgi:RNA recognition motif-containing protein
MAKVKTLFVSNISVTVNEQVLYALFSEYGAVVNCVIVKNAQTRQSRGFAFVEMDVRSSVMSMLIHIRQGRMQRKC